jgi:dynein heavy chain
VCANEINMDQSGSGMSDSMKTFLKREKKLPPSLRDSTARKPLSAAKGAVFGGKLIHSSSAPDFAVNAQNIQHRYDSGSRRKLPQLKKDPAIRAFPGQMRESPLKEWVTVEAKPFRKFEAPKPELEAMEDKSFLKLDQSKLPLHLFDNQEYETKTPQEWAASGSANAVSPFYMNAKEGWQWRPCTVLGYSQDPPDMSAWAKVGTVINKPRVTGKFQVQFSGSAAIKNVQRINLQFADEDEANFQARRAYAHTEMEKTKSLLRYDDYVNSQPSTVMRPMQPSTLEGIHDRVMGGMTPTTIVALQAEETRRPTWEDGDPPLSLTMLMRSLSSKVIKTYTWCMKKQVLMHRLATEADEQAHYAKLKLPPLQFAAPPPRYGKLVIRDVGMPYEDARAQIFEQHYTNPAEVRSLVLWFYKLWETNLVDTMFMDDALETVELPCKLGDFHSLQKKHCEDLTATLKVDWRQAVSENTTDFLQDTYDFFQAERAQFDDSPLAKLLKVTELRMRGQLRHIVTHSVGNWLAFIQRYCGATGGEIAAEEAVVEEEPAGDFLEKKKQEREALPGATPLFQVMLRISGDQVLMEPSGTEIKSVLQDAITQMVAVCCQFKTIDHELMSLLHLEPDIIYNLTGLNDEVWAVITQGRTDIEEEVDVASAKARVLAEKFSAFAWVMELNTAKHVHDYWEEAQAIGATETARIAEEDKKLKDDNPDKRHPETHGRAAALAHLLVEVRRLFKTVNEVTTMSYDQELFTLFSLDTTEAKQLLHDKALEVCHALLQKLVDNSRDASNSVISRYKAIQTRLGQKPKNEVELQALKDFMEKSKKTVADIKNEVADVHLALESLEEFIYPITEDDFKLSWSCKLWPNTFTKNVAECESMLEEDKVAMMDKLSAEKEEFDVLQDMLQDQVAAFKGYGDATKVQKFAEEANGLFDSLMQAQATAKDFNARDKVFGFPPTEYALLDQMEEDFDPFYKLWNMVADFNQCKVDWLTGSFLGLDAPNIESQVQDWFRTSYKMSKNFADEAPGSAAVALVLREGTGVFKEYLPMITALASPALRDRHWEKLSNELGDGLGDGIELQPDEELTLQTLLDMGMLAHMETVQGVSVAAEKEYSLEKALRGMQIEWEPIEFETMPYKNTGTSLVKGLDDIITLLDDQIVKVQTMRGSPFIKPVEDECKAWEKKLHYAQHLVDEWVSCQRTWLYLEPIFGSEDIMRQMPTEARRFQSVDALWRKNMADTIEDPGFMRCCDRDRLLEKFQQANQRLDEIQKGLNDYLETKRLSFPRFFFLSNDELLEILSQTKDPLAVQPHLGKCFEGVVKVKFEDDLKISTVISSEGERVDLDQIIDPESKANKGNVEKWLLELEQFTWDTLKRRTGHCVEGFKHNSRIDWMLMWPAQNIIAISQVYWTADVTKILNTPQEEKGGRIGLEILLEAMRHQLIDIVMLVRGKLSKNDGKKVGALVVMDVHSRDVQTMMIAEDVNFEHNFQWISQLRYYWEAESRATCTHQQLNSLNSKVVADATGEPGYLQARIVNARLTYGYEYLGNSMRLVVTPLTDRCYRTMMGAVALQYGGAPEGPAGTGKTETVKDLAKALACQCVVFNCSDGLDYLAMAKFFKGLASAGAWACFDEFNRINIEVLSVIAQQILEINVAKRQMEKTEKRPFMFHFEGSNISLNVNANAFITMNPGYAGRAELPDNLKALFRPCAMMVPDYAMIGEIRLYSFGFQDARQNACKLVQVLQLSSEQLSSQKHYDYGMRATNSILVAAGALRQLLGDDPKWSEAAITLRAVRDVNLPKFLDMDLPLFHGITSDLFPGLELAASEHDVLMECIVESCNTGVWIKAANGVANIEPNPETVMMPVPNFTGKVIQLYETILVRHSLMVVGQTCGGKTRCFHTLSKAMTLANSRGSTELEAVHIITMNPKSISSGQLYGNFDENTHEWSDGILAVSYRALSRLAEGMMRGWMVMDGPVDAVWIENMNTVMDDNRKLCLNSGEIIKMGEKQTIMIEPEDLEQASPATVSRNGVVFMEPDKIGWRPLVDSWFIRQLPKAGYLEKGEMKRFDSEEDIAFIHSLFDWLLPPALFFIMNHTTHPVPITPQELVLSLVNLLDCVFDMQEGIGSDHEKALEGAFVMALIWSVGACVNLDGRIKFDFYLRLILSGKGKGNEFHEDFLGKTFDYKVEPKECSCGTPDDKIGNMYDFCWDNKKLQWNYWLELAPKFSIAKGTNFSEIFVPTIDTVRNAHFVETLLCHKHHVMTSGETGTGKTATVLKKLLTGMPMKETEDGPQKLFKMIPLNFSAQTGSNQTQDIIDGKLDKRRKGVFAPPLGMTGVVFVDDLNMPAKEEYGAQPPIEILRQWMDHEGWYDLKENVYRRLVDILFMAAMGPPGGGRNHITQRYIRHFNLINFVDFSDEMLTVVYSTILTWFLGSFPGQVKGLAENTVAATIDVYNSIQKTLLPTPAKSHYTFNLRDISKVFQGMLQVTPEFTKTGSGLIQLWAHENMRIYHDRLIDESDRKWFKNSISEMVKKHYSTDWAKVKGPNEVIMYGNFVDPKSAKKPYCEVFDRVALGPTMAGYLEDFNMMTNKPMRLVLFQNAVEHVARINRILNLPLGNALLVGVGGSGRKSLTSLATSMAEYRQFSIEISKTYGMTEWHDDMKKVLFMAGLENEPTTFLFTDTQIKKEAFVEDINGILNTGEIPNLFNGEDMVAIMEVLVEPCAKKGILGEAEVYNFFVQRCRRNLHVVLAFSPVGDDFRTRLRMFPSLVNCCTIDWFTAWPEEALRSVATLFLSDVELDEKARDGVKDVCVSMQSTVSGMVTDYFDSMGRFYYVTPTSYLELINTFKDLLGKQRDKVMNAKHRYDNGLQKLVETAEQVDGMKAELIALQPKLVVAAKETNELIETVKHNTVAAEEKKLFVKSEEDKCGVQATEAGAIKADCEKDLAEAIPALEGAIKALKTLSKGDIVEVKAMKKPPPGVKLTMTAVCMMFGVKPNKIKDPEGGTKKVEDYWEPAQKQLLGDSRFLQNLFDYDKDNIPPAVAVKVTAFCEDEMFQPDKVKKASVAAAGMCKWVHAMMIYDRINKVVGPKKIALAGAEADLAEAQRGLAEKQAELKGVMDKLQELDDALQGAIDKKEALQNQVADCAKKLTNAEQLMNGLGGERTRWTQLSADLAESYLSVTGDILLSSGVIAYLGAFTTSYRQQALTKWATLMGTKNIRSSKNFSLTATLGEPTQIRFWTINKLPNDSFSIDNGIMLQASNRWPLMIDPQGQANRWTKNMEADNGLKIVKQNQASFVRTLEGAIQFGNPVLLENVPEALDPVLESVLLKQVVIQGGVPMIRLGDNSVEYDPNFKFYITTKLRNPHYPPETCVKVNLLNFMATEEGLQDQMQGYVVGKEQAELSAKRELLVMEDAENKQALKDIEDLILRLLKEAEGNILDDEVLINTLGESKVTSDKIGQKVKEAEKTAVVIDEVRQKYIPVAFRSSQLFFCIADLSSVDPMYQYSLEWFVALFLKSCDAATKTSDFDERLDNLNAAFTHILYQNVCRSLFEKDKLLFSFLLCLKIKMGRHELALQDLRYFLTGNTSMDLAEPNPKDSWLMDRAWNDVLGLNAIESWPSDFSSQFKTHIDRWEEVYNSSDPMVEVHKICDEFHPDFDGFKRMMLLRQMRPDEAVPEVQNFVKDYMGQKFIEPPPFDLAASYADSSCASPLIFVLSPGADPMSELLKLAEVEGMDKKLFAISLGQGQGPLAEEAMAQAIDKGTWVCLQNCHLYVSWMPTLERLCEEITPERVEETFRLWLTSEPSKAFPVFVLQNGVKMVNEPPKGMRASLMGTYMKMDPEFYESCVQPIEFKKILFGLAFFHATVIERKKFGPIGWNVSYVFSGPDYNITRDQLKIFLDDLHPGDPVPYAALAYLAGQCNYGGRVTDDKDRRCIVNILSDFYCDDIQKPDYKFSPSGTYFAPDVEKGGVEEILEYIRTLPFSEGPEVFGLHGNANITSAVTETNSLLGKALSLQPKTTGGSEMSWDEKLGMLSADIEKRLPKNFDEVKALLDFPVRYDESMNTVLTQELGRFNKLIDRLRSTLYVVQRAIKGLVVLSQDLETMGNSMVNGLVPGLWNAVSYPSMKPLGSWVIDFLARLKFLQDWCDNPNPVGCNNCPDNYWISGFFFTQAFITGTKQNYSRKHKLPIDEVNFDFSVLTPEERTKYENTPGGPDDGAHIWGLYMDGGRWDEGLHAVTEQRPKELYSEVPMIHLAPAHISKIELVEDSDPGGTAHIYICPTYKTSIRFGMLTTTGHSTNFVMFVRLPMEPQHRQKHWIKRGCAMLTQLDT